MSSQTISFAGENFFQRKIDSVPSTLYTFFMCDGRVPWKSNSGNSYRNVRGTIRLANRSLLRCLIQKNFRKIFEKISQKISKKFSKNFRPGFRKIFRPNSEKYLENPQQIFSETLVRQRGEERFAKRMVPLTFL